MLSRSNRRSDARAVRCIDDDTEIEPDVSSADINIVVAQIRRLTRTAGIEFALRVGAVIIHHFYDGSPDAWRSRGPKTASFRRLAQHPGLPLSAGALYRCVAVFELCDRLNAASRWENLGVSHLRVVIGLPSDIQERMLAEANSKRWTVEVLHQAAARERGRRLARGGRQAAPPLAKCLQSVRKRIEEHREVLEQADRLSRHDRERSRQLVEETRRWLERLSASLPM
jgi:hypothetical protein